MAKEVWEIIERMDIRKTHRCVSPVSQFFTVLVFSAWQTVNSRWSGDYPFPKDLILLYLTQNYWQ